nr:uncharacterized protein LOC117281436 isoform X3 [Nicotiana tomentosiformis]
MYVTNFSVLLVHVRKCIPSQICAINCNFHFAMITDLLVSFKTYDYLFLRNLLSNYLVEEGELIFLKDNKEIMQNPRLSDCEMAVIDQCDLLNVLGKQKKEK